MQLSALRAVWSLQHIRGSLPLALQQALAFITNAQSIPASSTLAGDLTSSERGCSSALCPSSFLWGASGSREAMSTAAVTALPAPPSPSTGAFSVEIAVQGFEKRYVDMACSTIDDIIMLAFAPKSFSALPTGAPAPADMPINLAFGAARRDVHLPWRRTRFTLIRGPHIDKQGMEQFERREYKSVLTAATNSREELQRLLEALKIYQFTGVQLRVDVTSAQQLELPADLREALAVGAGTRAGPVSGPRKATSASQPPTARSPAGPGHVLGSAVATIPAPRSPEALFEEELATVLGILRPMVLSGLLQRKGALESVPEYGTWRRGQDRQQQIAGGIPPVAAASAGPEASEGLEAEMTESGGHVYSRLLRQRMRQQLELLRQLSTAESQPREERQTQGAASPSGAAAAAAAASYGLEPAVAAELLARIDAELLHAYDAASQGPETTRTASPAADNQGASIAAGAGAASGYLSWSGPPYLDSSKMSPAGYAHAVLKYVQYVNALYDASGMAEARHRADTQLQLAAPSLALRLLQLWWAATSAEFKQHLALPPAEVEKRILEERARREEKARAAAASPAEGRAAGAGAVSGPGMGSAGGAVSQAAAGAGHGAGAQGQGQGQGEQGTRIQGRGGRPGQQSGGGGTRGGQRGSRPQKQQQR